MLSVKSLHVIGSLLIPVVFLTLGPVIKRWVDKTPKWEHWFLGVELFLATVTSSSIYMVEQLILIKQCELCHADPELCRAELLPGYFAMPDFHVISGEGNERLAEHDQNDLFFFKSLAIEGTLRAFLYTFLAVIGLVVAMEVQKKCSPARTRRRKIFLAITTVAGSLALIGFLLAVKGFDPEPILGLKYGTSK